MIGATELTERELEQRVAILKKLRENLLLQREKFRNYLHVLEKEAMDLDNDDIDTLQQHVEMEKALVSEIYAFQKVIDPLEEMYLRTHPTEEPEIKQLQHSLESMKEQVLARNSRNKERLKERMEGIRNRLLNIKKPYPKRSLYSSPAPPSLIDITT